MLPDLFSMGPLTIHTYGVFVALGSIAGILIAIRLGKPLGITSQQVMDMGFIMILCGVIGSRLAYIFLNFSFYKSHLLDSFKLWQGGLVFSGGLVAGIIALAVYIKKHKLSIWVIGDIWAPAAALGQAIGRVGCFMAGCCYGKPTDIFWGVTFSHPQSLAPLHIPIHPTQLYSSLSGMIIFIITLVLSTKKKFQGQVLLWFLILHSTGRLLIERFRGDDRGFIMGSKLTSTQVVTILILLFSVAGLIILKTRHEKGLGGK
ncbi:prolipoprotein diacylglyceryl transferase [Thermodesulfobacteriota bacterium]